MGKESQSTAQEAILNKLPLPATPFVCPYPDCGVFAQHHWGITKTLAVQLGANSFGTRAAANEPVITLAKCEACSREAVFVGFSLVWPRSSGAPGANSDMPADVMADFNEARLIYPSSPRGAAALLRLALQKLLPQIGATKSGINAAIGQLVKAGTLSVRIQQALDTVRVIGNEAVHPGELDLRDDAATVLSLFKLLNIIVEKAISEPKEMDSLYAGLPPSKIEGIKKRDGKKDEAESE